MITNGELREIVEGMGVDAEVDKSILNNLIGQVGGSWECAVKEKGNGIQIYSRNNSVSDLTATMSIDDIEEKIKQRYHGIPHELKKVYKRDGDVIYIAQSYSSVVFEVMEK